MEYKVAAASRKREKQDKKRGDPNRTYYTDKEAPIGFLCTAMERLSFKPYGLAPPQLDGTNCKEGRRTHDDATDYPS